MNWIICRNTLKEILRNNLRMCLLALLLLAPIGLTTINLCLHNVFPARVMSDSGIAMIFALIWGAGVIGRHIQDGTLSLVLSRPLTISQLVMSKWFAIGTASACTALVQLLAELVVAATRSPLPTALEISMNGLERVLVAYSVSASLILLSSLVGGVKDLGLYLCIGLLQLFLQSLSAIKSDAVKASMKVLAKFGLACAASVSSILNQFTLPPLQMHQWVLSGTMPWLQMFAYLAMVTGSLSLAIFLLNRKELPYGAA